MKEDILTLKENIARLSLRCSASARQGGICAEELLSLIIRDGAYDTPEDAYGAFLSSIASPNALPPYIKCGAVKRLFECGKFDGQLLGPALFGDGDLPLPGTHGKIAYVKNHNNDLAFSFFSKKIKNPKPLYCSSFPEACEEVYNNSAEFCILPISSTSDGKLFRFYSMLETYELKVLFRFFRELEDASEKVCYGLLGRRHAPELYRTHELTFEFSLVNSKGDFFSNIVSAIEFFGCELSETDSIRVRYDDKVMRYYFSVLCGYEKARRLALFLSLEYPEYSPIGIYPTEG